ncbi:zinc finger ccch domain-containing protein 11a [Limosa lapponica baueri]|uniref:Zinc finger ccch domain-containing protein 11a n=1 Tax=Limosa lapponica baueri TaxID=1758121 RepID=A0A2I0T6V6_LIMLA|nr:zinc finger ccch domain-containing protein 11a [Limosa lapponica baueri]
MESFMTGKKPGDSVGWYQQRTRLSPGEEREGAQRQQARIEITEWFGLEGTLKIIQFQPPALGRDTSHHTRVVKAPSNLALNPSRDGAATASLGNLGQGLTTLTAKNLYPRSHLNLPSSSLKPFFLIFPHPPDQESLPSFPWWLGFDFGTKQQQISVQPTCRSMGKDKPNHIIVSYRLGSILNSRSTFLLLDKG